MSGRLYANIAFLFLNAATAFFIAWLMRIRLSSFAIIAVINGWDLDEKAMACRNAGLMYLVIAVVLSIHSIYKQHNTHTEDAERYETELMEVQEGMPLLYSTTIGLLEPSTRTGGSRSRSRYGS